MSTVKSLKPVKLFHSCGLQSRGAHARDDFTERDDTNWMVHTLAWAHNNNCTLDYRPVHTYTLSNEVKYIEPKARVY